MAEEYPKGCESETTAKDRGFFDCFGKKEEKPKEDHDVGMVEAECKPSPLMEKLHRSNSSSSSSSEEEIEEGGVKIRRRKKKGLTEKIKEKLAGHKDHAVNMGGEDNKYQANAEEEKKGFLEKMKEKMPLPGPGGAHHKQKDEAPDAAPGLSSCQHHDEPAKDKKGILDKIKEKLPGGGHKDGDHDPNKDHY